jgi:hypothetical protein
LERPVSGDGGVGVEALEGLLDRTRQALDAAGSVDLRAGSVSAEGVAAGGLIRASVSPNRVESVRIDPRAMRLGSAELAVQVSAAINAAFMELRERAGLEEVRREAQARAAVVSGQLREVQDDAMRSMAMISQALTDAVAQFGRSRG